jgi:hypothetical protein
MLVARNPRSQTICGSEDGTDVSTASYVYLRRSKVVVGVVVGARVRRRGAHQNPL